MNLAHWRLLVATADTGNISRAAERVGITQSGASQALAHLEASLGLTVFTRSRRQVAVTALGEPVVAHARAMLDSLEAIRSLADAARELDQGSIRVGSFPSVISSWLPGLLRHFGLRHPGIDVVALEGADEEVEQWLAQGAIDLGVVLNPAKERQALVLGSDAWMVLLPAAHPMARRSAALGLGWHELAAQPFILATGGCAVNGRSLAGQAGVDMTDIRVTVRDWASACALVREGMGLSVVPESTLPLDMRGLRALPLSPAVYRHFGLVRSPQAQAHAAVLDAFWAQAADRAGRGYRMSALR
ncbi:MAG: LysR family transcriptional regulator [Burkholderiaceae bacterium]|nr:LysR family transcriptional regulator [Burkholderiaceae bacterium]